MIKRTFHTPENTPAAVVLTATKSGANDDVFTLHPDDVPGAVSAFIRHGYRVSLEPVFTSSVEFKQV